MDSHKGLLCIESTQLSCQQQDSDMQTKAVNFTPGSPTAPEDAIDMAEDPAVVYGLTQNEYSFTANTEDTC